MILVLCSALAAGYAQAPRQPTLVRATLPNGLRLVVASRPGARLVALDLWVGAGTAHEGSSGAGTAHFLEHMAFRGTTTRASSQIDFDAEILGGVLNAGTTRAGAHYHICVPAARTAEALSLLADILLRPTIPEEAMERERQVILDEIARAANFATTRLTDALLRQLFPDHVAGRSLLGTRESVSRMDRAAILEFRAARYRPDNAVLAIAGKVDVERVQAAVASAFGGWTVQGGQQAEEPAVPARLPPPSTIPWDGQRGRVAAGLALALPVLSPEDFDAVSLLPYLWRMRLTEWDEDDVEVRLERLPHHEILLITTQCEASAIRDRILAWTAALDELSGRGPTEEELNSASAMRTRDRLSACETAEGMARLLAEEELTGRRLPLPFEGTKAYRANGNRLTEILAQALASGWLSAAAVPADGSSRR